jgi:hypothetical protein
MYLHCWHDKYDRPNKSIAIQFIMAYFGTISSYILAIWNATFTGRNKVTTVNFIYLMEL